MSQRLSRALAQVKPGNISENLLNKIWEIIYSLHRAKEIAKQVYIKYNEYNLIITQNGYYIHEF